MIFIFYVKTMCEVASLASLMAMGECSRGLNIKRKIHMSFNGIEVDVPSMLLKKVLLAGKVE